MKTISLGFCDENTFRETKNGYICVMLMTVERYILWLSSCTLYFPLSSSVSVEGSRFKQSLVAAGDVQVDILKSDVNFSTVAPYYLGVNLTTMTVHVFI